MTIKFKTRDESIYQVQDGVVRTITTEDDKTILQTYQDVEPIIERNKILRELDASKSRKGEVYRQIASVPVDIYEKAVREGWADDMKAWDRWLNNSENAVFRVWDGHL